MCKYEQIFTKGDHILLYEGKTYKGMPYGAGTAYFPNGNKYQEGVFDIKGLILGKEYYPNGNVRFEGMFRIHTAYGPNPPVYGRYYDPEGKCLYEGKFQCHYGGVNYPIVVQPKGYGSIVQHEKPEISYISWQDLDES